MIIKAKDNTELKNALIELHEKKIAEQEKAKRLAKEIFGAEIDCLTYRWGLWWSFWYTLDYVILETMPVDVPAHIQVVSGDRGIVAKLNKRYKKSKEILKEWKDTFRGIRPSLEHLGISVSRDSKYCSWDVLRCGDEYYFVAPEWVFDFDILDENSCVIVGEKNFKK